MRELIAPRNLRHLTSLLRLARETGKTMAWQADGVLFVLQGPFGLPEAYSLFQELTGTQAQSLGPMPGQTGNVAGGSFDKYQLQVQVRSNRIDLGLLVAPVEKEFGLISDPTDALERLEPLAQKLADKFAAHRLSFVTTLAQVADSPESAANIFYEKLRIPRVDAVPLDLSFQYNRAGTSTGGFRLNRLFKWQVVNVQIQALVVGPDAPPATTKQAEYFALHLTLDVNIPTQRAPVDTRVAKTTVKELAEQTKMLISEVS